MRIRAAALILVGLQGTVWGQRQYDGLRFPPYEVYEALSGYAESGNLSALATAAAHLSSLTAALDPAGAKNLSGAISRAAVVGDGPASIRAVRELIFEDLRFNLGEFRHLSGERRRDLLQMAFMDYHFLSSAVLARDTALDRAVRRAFKTAYRSGEIAPLEAAVERVAAAVRGP